MTDQEANTKWCPLFSACTGINNVSAILLKQIGAPPEKSAQAASSTNFYCIGSACMMWRNEFDIMSDPDKPKLSMLPPKLGVSGGYCGLAGKP